MHKEFKPLSRIYDHVYSRRILPAIECPSCGPWINACPLLLPEEFILQIPRKSVSPQEFSGIRDRITQLLTERQAGLYRNNVTPGAVLEVGVKNSKKFATASRALATPNFLMVKKSEVDTAPEEIKCFLSGTSQGWYFYSVPRSRVVAAPEYFCKICGLYQGDESASRPVSSEEIDMNSPIAYVPRKNRIVVREDFVEWFSEFFGNDYCDDE